ncbi:hypothetical protein [Burkholderia stagnalis]
MADDTTTTSLGADVPNLLRGTTIVRENATLLGRFETRGDPSLSAFIELKKSELLREAIEDEAWETKRDRERDERFE